MLKLKVTVKQQTGKDDHIMKILIASDIHGSAYYCRLLLERYREEKADKLLLLGDILYHGPRNDLPRGYAPKEELAMLKKFSVSEETATQRWIRWCWNFPFLQSIVFCMMRAE